MSDMMLYRVSSRAILVEVGEGTNSLAKLEFATKGLELKVDADDSRHVEL